MVLHLLVHRFGNDTCAATVVTSSLFDFASQDWATAGFGASDLLHQQPDKRVTDAKCQTCVRDSHSRV